MVKHKKAFTVLELVITLAIIGILAAIGIPLYKHHMAVSHRADGQIALLKLATAMENYYLKQRTYHGANFHTLEQTDSSPEGYYTLAIVLENDGQSYQLKAIPVGQQAKLDTQCGTLQLSTDGRRSFIGHDPKAQCW